MSPTHRMALERARKSLRGSSSTRTLLAGGRDWCKVRGVSPVGRDAPVPGWPEGKMTDRTDAGEDKRPSGGNGDPGVHPPFMPPFGSPFSPPFAAPFAPPFPWPFFPPIQPPESQASTAWYRPFLEAQRSYLRWYREQLEQFASDENGDDRRREALNALIASWLETVRSLREQQQQALRAQVDLVKHYLNVLDRLLAEAGDSRP